PFDRPRLVRNTISTAFSSPLFMAVSSSQSPLNGSNLAQAFSTDKNLLHASSNRSSDISKSRHCHVFGEISRSKPRNGIMALVKSARTPSQSSRRVLIELIFNIRPTQERLSHNIGIAGFRPSRPEPYREEGLP